MLWKLQTYISKVLIAINPYKPITIFGSKEIEKYRGKPFGSLAPHIYSIGKFNVHTSTVVFLRIMVKSFNIHYPSDKRYLHFWLNFWFFFVHLFIANEAQEHMFFFKKSQSILITGVSGSGKTETGKHAAAFLCGESEEHLFDSSHSILEAFGNACTYWNSNSSRFCKYIEVSQ